MVLPPDGMGEGPAAPRSPSPHPSPRHSALKTRVNALKAGRGSRPSSQRAHVLSAVGVCRMNSIDRTKTKLARNVRRLGHLDLPGGGQVTVSGAYAYVGHIPNPDHLGTSIIDIADPGKPRVIASIKL